MTLKKLSTVLLLMSLFSYMLTAQNKISRVEPPNWWVGMKNPEVQLLIYGEKVADSQVEIDHPGVDLKRVIRVENPNYLFVDLVIEENARPGDVSIHFTKENQLIASHEWSLLKREKKAEDFDGFDNSDVLYLITPDRFANGDTGNDAIEGMKEAPDRNFKGGRHGGDIAGIRQHLDYIKEMGFTAIWVNPVLENDMERYSYHGYSTTDFYKVDPRFGTNESYRQLVKESGRKGIKFIMDMIVNHSGLNHWWLNDPPMDDWINQWDEPAYTNHQKSVLQDPYASKSDKKGFTDGWFVSTMPDLNQRNEMMGKYLTQNSIWWVEYLGLAGIRMDTYPYPDMYYMADWTKALMTEYPNLNIVGEEWHEAPAVVAYWQRGKVNPNGYTSELPSLMDFPLQAAMSKGLSEPESRVSGLKNLYEMLSRDFLYADPDNLVVFPDNHDMSRIFSQLNEDFGLYKLAIAYVLTTRGIPQIYYGTEILMKNPGTSDHGIIRSDFPGGWPGDKVNGFTGEGLTGQQKKARDFMKKMLNWRKNAEVVHTGKLMHFIPEEGVYVYFRYNDDKKVMVILNKNDRAHHLDLKRFEEMLEDVNGGMDVLSEKRFNFSNGIDLPARSPLILELE